MNTPHFQFPFASGLPGRRSVLHRAGLRAILWLLLFSAGMVRAETLISCAASVSGDLYTRGFYVPHFPGNRLDAVQLYFSASVAGSSTATLTVRAGTYDGAVLGSATRTFTLDGTLGEERAVTFTFPSVPVVRESRVCLVLTRSAGSGSLYYAVPAFTGGCSEVVQTEGTTPPLSGFRRNGVKIVISGQETLVVAPGETIQAAIDAASPGETVVVEPGTYTEDLTLRSDVNVAGAGFNSTILRGTGAGSVVRAVNVTNCQFAGFKITNSGTGSGHAGVDLRGGSVLVDNNWIVGNLNGVQVYNGSSSIVRNNIVEGNGSAGNGVLDYGIIVLHSTPLLANNLVVSNTAVGVYIGWADSAGTEVINNTVVGNANSGIWCYNGGNAVIRNNISAWNNTGISATHGAVPVIAFNDVWGNSWHNYDSQSGGVAVPGVGDISADPQFDPAASPPFALAEGSPCIDAGDPAAIYRDRDGSRNDMGAFGGPTGLVPGMGTAVTSGFLFTSIGKIPTSEITRTGDQAGLANVSPAVAGALSLYPYRDAPFGGNLWLNGLFGMSDTSIRYYRLYAAKWSGATAPAAVDFTPVTDPLAKIKYTINPGGTVTASLEAVGPDANGLYLRTDRPDSGYWAHPDLKLIWNTRRLESGRYDVVCKGYWLFLGVPIEVPLPSNELSRITVQVDNQGVTARIDSVRDHLGNTIPECGLIPVGTDQEEVQFEISAMHPGGYLRDYRLEAWYGRNRYGGVIAADQYVGSHDVPPPVWGGVSTTVVSSIPAHAGGTLDPWTTCAYQFRLRAWARTTDGFTHIYANSFSDHYFVSLGRLFPTACVADLDGDGDVDGADLAIFGSQYGRTNCVTAAGEP